MIKLTSLAIIILLFYGCNSDLKNHKENSDILETDLKSDTIKSQLPTHLKDTVKISGNTILILRPDSLRFQSYLDAGKEWIYEVDSDFGFGFSIALDSVNINGVNEDVTDKRFVKILGCKDCPILIDRDTIDYGFILVKTNESIRIDNSVFSSEYYIQEFEQYFNR